MPITVTTARYARAAFAAAALALAAAPLAAQDFPDLKGTWTGTGWGVISGALGHHEPSDEPRFKDTTETWTVEITEQEGGAVIGTFGSDRLTETLIGAIAADGTTLNFVDEDSILTGTLRSDNEMALCIQETGPAMVATCYVMTRE